MQQDNFQPLPKSLKYLVIVIVVTELLATANDYGFLPVDQLRSRFIILGGLWPQYFTEDWRPLYFGQQYLMLFTHAFVHAGILHMAMNTAILLALGKRLQMVIGSKWVLILFFLSAGVGGALFVLLNTSGAPAVGASGAAFGFFGFWKFLEYRMLQRAGLPLTPIFQFVGVMVGINLIFWFGFGGALAWEAHLGGFVAGWGLGSVFKPNSRQRR